MACACPKVARVVSPRNTLDICIRHGRPDRSRNQHTAKHHTPDGGNNERGGGPAVVITIANVKSADRGECARRPAHDETEEPDELGRSHATLCCVSWSTPRESREHDKRDEHCFQEEDCGNAHQHGRQPHQIQMPRCSKHTAPNARLQEGLHNHADRKSALHDGFTVTSANMYECSRYGVSFPFSRTLPRAEPRSMNGRRRLGPVIDYVRMQHDWATCRDAVIVDGLSLQHVPPRFRDMHICRLAVQQAPFALQHVPFLEQSFRLCIMAVRRDGLALRFVPEARRTEWICWIAVSNNGGALIFAPWVRRREHIWRCALRHGADAAIFSLSDAPRSAILDAIFSGNFSPALVRRGLGRWPTAVAAAKCKFADACIASYRDVNIQILSEALKNRRLPMELIIMIADFASCIGGVRIVGLLPRVEAHDNVHEALEWHEWNE